jgi:hypothetical protein
LRPSALGLIGSWQPAFRDPPPATHADPRTFPFEPVPALTSASPSKPSKGISMTYATAAPATAGGPGNSPVRTPHRGLACRESWCFGRHYTIPYPYRLSTIDSILLSITTSTPHHDDDADQPHSPYARTARRAPPPSGVAMSPAPSSAMPVACSSSFTAARGPSP